MKVSANAYAKKIVSSMESLIACEKKVRADRGEKEKCLIAAVESVSTSRELEALFEGARLELKRLGQ